MRCMVRGRSTARRSIGDAMNGGEVEGASGRKRVEALGSECGVAMVRWAGWVQARCVLGRVESQQPSVRMEGSSKRGA